MPIKQAVTHTPGPWTVEPWSYDNGRRMVHTIQTKTDAVAQLCNLYRHPDHTDADAEMMANARLIASAPELLEALESCWLELRQMHQEYQPDCKGGCPTTAAMLQARDAIRKARGEV